MAMMQQVGRREERDVVRWVLIKIHSRKVGYAT